MKFWQALTLLCTLTVQQAFAYRGEDVESSTEWPVLSCYTCVSNVSWEHCNEAAKVRKCDSDDLCLTIKIDKPESRTANGKMVTTYAKYCSKQCSDKQCRTIGWLCDVNCCSRDKCNASAPNGIPVSWAHTALVSSLCYLALQNAFAF